MDTATNENSSQEHEGFNDLARLTMLRRNAKRLKFSPREFRSLFDMAKGDAKFLTDLVDGDRTNEAQVVEAYILYRLGIQPAQIEELFGS